MSTIVVCVCADDIPLQRRPLVIIPVGPFWDELEAFWSDLVHELPDIPDGGNRYFGDHLKPSLGDIPNLCDVLRHGTLMCLLPALTSCSGVEKYA